MRIHDVRFLAWEPFGDDDRCRIVPQPPRPVPELAPVRAAFAAAGPPRLSSRGDRMPTRRKSLQATLDPSERGHLVGDVPALMLIAVVLGSLAPRRR